MPGGIEPAGIGRHRRFGGGPAEARIRRTANVALGFTGGVEHLRLEQGARQAALADDRAERAAIQLAMQRHWKRNRPAAHDHMAAALPHLLESMFRQEIAKLRA